MVANPSPLADANAARFVTRFMRRSKMRMCGTPLSFRYDTAGARMYTTFCEDVPGEHTGESAAAQEFLASMHSNQRGE